MNVRVDTEDGPVFLEVVEGLDPSIAEHCAHCGHTREQLAAMQRNCIPDKE